MWGCELNLQIIAAISVRVRACVRVFFQVVLAFCLVANSARDIEWQVEEKWSRCWGGPDCFLRWSLACTEQARMIRRSLSWFHLVDQFAAQPVLCLSYIATPLVSKMLAVLLAVCQQFDSRDSITISRRISITHVLSLSSVERARERNVTVDWRSKPNRLSESNLTVEILIGKNHVTLFR